MRTLYYIRAGIRFFGFHVDHGHLTLSNRGVAFLSFGAVLAWAGEHDFDFVANCEPEALLRVASQQARRAGNRL